MTELLWTYDTLQQLKKIISVLAGKGDKTENFLFLEYKQNKLYLYTGHLVNTVVLFYELKPPFFKLPKEQADVKANFSANKLNKAIKLFCSKNDPDQIKMTITTEDITFHGYKKNEIISQSEIKACNADFPDSWNATELTRNNGMAFAFVMDMYVNDLLQGLISLHVKENTTITIKEGKMSFQCGDDSGMISQTQYVPTITKIPATWDIEKAVGAEGLSILQQFLNTIQGSKEKKENNGEEKEPKKRKIEKVPEDKIKITYSLDFQNPIFVHFEKPGLISKIFVATKMTANDD